MNTKSIKFRLTVLYSTILLLSTAVIFSTFYYITQQELYTHTDNLLRSHGEKVRDLVAQEPEINRNMSSPTLLFEYSEIPGMIFFVTDNQGTPVFMSQAVGNKPVADLFTKFDTTKQETTVTYPIGSLAMRFVLLPLKTKGILTSVIMMGHPIDVIETSLHSLYGALFLVFLAFIVPSLFGGYILAGRALGPVREIAQEMETIESENLKKRVKNPRTGDEIELLSCAFNNLLSRLEGAFTRERLFMGDVAHELKTPLATIKTGAEVTLSRDRSVKEYKEAIADIVKDTDRASRTLTALLDLAWSETDASQQRLEPVSVTEILTELTEIANKLGTAKKITVRSTLDPDASIMGKRDKVFRAFLNIIDNAVKYSKPAGTVTITLHKKKNNVVAIIKDTGKGISESDLPHIYDRFYRAQTTDATEGSGLGLAISHRIITALNGTIEIKSKVGKGTEVVVVFPS